MPHKLRVVCLSLLLLTAATTPIAGDAPRNTKPFSRFKVFLQGVLNDTLPFDVPFIVWGDVPDPKADHLTLRIAVIDSGTSCSTVPSGRFEIVDRVELHKWTESDYNDRGLPVPGDLAAATRKQFELVIKPLVPSRFYCFLFQTEPGRPLTNAEASVLGAQLLPAYAAFIRGLGLVLNVPQSEIERLRQQLVHAVLTAVPLTGFRPKAGTLFDPEADPATVSGPFTIAAAAVFQEHTRVVRGLMEFQGTTNPGQRTTSLQTWQRWSDSSAFRTIIQPLGVPAATRDLLNALITLSTADRANLLVGVPPGSPPQVLTDVQTDSSLAAPPAAGYLPTEPCPTGAELGQRCVRLDEWRARIGQAEALVRTAGNLGLANDIHTTFLDFEEQKIRLLNLQYAANQREAAMARHLAALQATIAQDYTALLTTIGNFDTRRSWYLSMDTGIAIAPGLNEIFPYVGTNIYFRPINKEAPPTVFLSRFSMLLGFTWTSNLIKPGETRALFGDNANLILGAGLRATDVLRFNGGILVVKGVNPNPLINRTRIEVTPYFSLSADIDVAGIMSGLFGAGARPPGTLGGSPRP